MTESDLSSVDTVPCDPHDLRGNIYDLQGRRLPAIPTGTIYIRNGKNTSPSNPQSIRILHKMSCAAMLDGIAAQLYGGGGGYFTRSRTWERRVMAEGWVTASSSAVHPFPLSHATWQPSERAGEDVFLVAVAYDKHVLGRQTEGFDSERKYCGVGFAYSHYRALDYAVEVFQQVKVFKHGADIAVEVGHEYHGKRACSASRVGRASSIHSRAAA